MPSIRPIEMQQMLNQMQHIAASKHNEMEKNIVNQNVANKEVKQEYFDEKHKVNRTEKSERIHLDPKNGNGSRGNYDKNGKQNKNKNDDTDENNDIIVDGHIDVIV